MRAILLRMVSPPGGWAAAQDLRDTIAQIRTKKPVYAWVQNPGNGLVYLASACDRVFLLPTGDVPLLGVGAELTFVGALFERLGIEPDLEAAGAYKSFGEPFTRTFASPASQEAMGALVSDLQQQLVAGIAAGRGRTVDEVTAWCARAPLSAPDALEAGAVDQLAYPDEALDWIAEKHGVPKKPVAFAAWALRDRVVEAAEALSIGPKRIAVLHLAGGIAVDGPGSRIASRRVVPMIDKLADDDRISAVVLHVDSPGGSAVASDLLWRALGRLAAKKPLVAAYEDVSASGGVYFTAPAAEILARAGTLTGSIGVFGGKLVLGGLRKVGIHHQPIEAAPNATMFSASHPFTDAQRVTFKASLQRFYDAFVQRVADGRKREVAQIEPHCRGRVWTGNAALERGLIDQIGGLDAAVARASALAGVPEGRFLRVDLDGRPKTLAQRLMAGVARQNPAARALLAFSGWSDGMSLIAEHPEQVMAMWPYEGNFGC